MESTGSRATSALFLRTVSDSCQSFVSLAAAAMVSWPPAIALAKSAYSKRPSRMAATMSGPARRPKVCMPMVIAFCSSFMSRILGMSAASAFCGSSPALAKVLSANFMPVSTVEVLTPSFSHLASIATELPKLKPMLRSGAPNSTTVCMRSLMPMPDCWVARKTQVEGIGLVLALDGPVTEEARAEAHVLGDVGPGDAAELEELPRQLSAEAAR